MTIIVMCLLLFLRLKCRWHRPFSRPGPRTRVFFQGGGGSVDSWTPGAKPLSHRHPTGPVPSGLLWTPWMARRRKLALVVGSCGGRLRLAGALDLLARPLEGDVQARDHE